MPATENLVLNGLMVLASALTGFLFQHFLQQGRERKRTLHEIRKEVYADLVIQMLSLLQLVRTLRKTALRDGSEIPSEYWEEMKTLAEISEAIREKRQGDSECVRIEYVGEKIGCDLGQLFTKLQSTLAKSIIFAGEDLAGDLVFVANIIHEDWIIPHTYMKSLTLEQNPFWIENCVIANARIAHGAWPRIIAQIRYELGVKDSLLKSLFTRIRYFLWRRKVKIIEI